MSIHGKNIRNIAVLDVLSKDLIQLGGQFQLYGASVLFLKCLCNLIPDVSSVSAFKSCDLQYISVSAAIAAAGIITASASGIPASSQHRNGHCGNG